jgi:urate oxidase
VAIVLGANQYGKAENRLVRVYRDTPRHEIRDLNVSTALRCRFEDAHVAGDQKDVLPTDTQKNTVFALAKERGVGAIEDFATILGDHLIHQTPAAAGARIEIEEYAWKRIPVDGVEHDHAFVRTGPAVRTTVVNIDARGSERRAYVVSGVQDLVVAKTTGSEFHGFLRDEYTTLQETTDRVLATSLRARWRYDHTEVTWDASYAAIKAVLLQEFARIHSLALQQTLYGMGKAVLERHPEVAEIRLSAPNKHHLLVDLSPFGDDNPGEVFVATDRPYGLIEATVERDDASEPGSAWHDVPGFC